MRVLKISLLLTFLLTVPQFVSFYPRQARLAADQNVTIQISGVITRPGGGPAAGVLVEAWLPTDISGRATTNEMGYYQLSIQAGDIIMHVTPPLESRLAAKNLNFGYQDASFTQNIQLADGHLLAGKVTLPDGRAPEHGLWLSLSPMTFSIPEHEWIGAGVIPGDGQFQVVVPKGIYAAEPSAYPPYYATYQSVDLRSADRTGLVLPLAADYSHPIPYDPPLASKITIGAVDGLGEAQIKGAPGAVLPLAHVLLVNLNSTHQVHTISEADGSFAVKLYAPPGSAIQIKHGTHSYRWDTVDSGTAEGVNPFPGVIIHAPFNPDADPDELSFATAGAVETFYDDSPSTRNTVGSAWSVSGTMSSPQIDGQWSCQLDGKFEGNFQPGLYLGGLNWTHPALVDLDADADLDLLVGEEYGQLILLRNKGTPAAPAWQFEEKGYANIDTTYWAYPALADVNNDGAPDLFVGTGGGVIQVYYNSGSAASASWPSVPDVTLQANWNAAPALADLDHDGDLDLLVGHGEGSLLFFRNTGTINQPSWSAQPGKYGNINEPGHGLQPGFVDLDGDDDLDLLIGRGGDFVWYRNQGPASNPSWARVTDGYAGIYSSSALSPGLGDWDGDGDTDLVTGEHWGRLNFYRNAGISNWEWQNIQFPFELEGDTSPALTDWDADGDLDMLIGQAHGRVHRYQNEGSKTTADWTDEGVLLVLPWTNHPRAAPTFADIDNDGAPELFIGEGGLEGEGAGGNIHYYHNDGTSKAPLWNKVTSNFLGLDVGGWSKPVFVDINDDGDLDLFVGAEDGTLTYIENTGSAASPSWAAAEHPYADLDLGAFSAPSFLDVDADGDLDMLVGLDHGSLAYIRNEGTASQPSWKLISSVYPEIDVGRRAVPAAADMNGDGQDDLLVGNEAGGIALYLYEGPGAFRSAKAHLDPGDLLQIKGTIRLYGPAIDAGTDVQAIDISGWLSFLMINNSAGDPLAAQNSFVSSVLTPTGLPVQGGQQAREFAHAPLRVSNLKYMGGHMIEGTLAVETSLAQDMPAGFYRPLIAIGFQNVPTSEEWVAANVTGYYTYGYDSAALAPIAVGEVDEPKLAWRLLMDDFAQGTRGVSAAEDRDVYNIASQIVTQGAPYYIPRVDPYTNEAISYRLEPFLPMISFTDRRLPAPPLIPFDLPGGQLCVTIQKPDGTTKNLGCEALAQSFNRTRTTRFGHDLNSGTVQLEDVYSLTTASNRFRYIFDQYGKHVVTMTGTIKDLWNNSYSGGGSYEVWVADALDIDPGVLPGTPLAAGDAFNPALQFYPQVPAAVNMTITHFPESDPAQKEVFAISGTANDYGYFSSADPAVTLDKPGEYRVDLTAVYTNSSGRQYMGSMTWGGIVMTPESKADLIAHGRRGMDSLNYIPNHWFVIDRDLSIDAKAISHILNPYYNGDILWSGQVKDSRYGDSLIMGSSVQDTVGSIESAVRARYNKMWLAISPPGDINERFSKGEIPLFSSTRSGRAIQMVPNDAEQIAYAYRSSQRPGVRVREVVAEDGESGGYWRLNTLYDDQLGVGILGDQPNDFKFQYVGAVYRDLQTGHNEYVGQGTGWIFIPEDDPLSNRVMPPFAGPGNGGWTTEGGPILRLKGKDIHIFIFPTGVKPGAVLEVGDTFHFAGHIMPPLNSQVEVNVTAPSGTKYQVAGRANSIGYFYDPEDDFVVNEPGLWSVDVKVWHDGMCSGGATVPPYPSGDVLGSDNGRYYFYVVSGGERLDVSSPTPGFLSFNGEEITPVTVSGAVPTGLSEVSVSYTIGMPGTILQQGQAAVSGGKYQFDFDPLTLFQDFPNLDLTGREDFGPGLSDTFSIGLLLRGKRGNVPVVQANVITVQGNRVFVGGSWVSATRVNLPVILGAT